ncbi:hypothetical protein [Halovenus salina]|uniref:Twin-arginine translocation signal domain-containing protein n=1 Tax=Halovenus salina TaxID=1510225 RepID=A0ABD5W375_9EURY
MDRRRFLATASSLAGVALAGCLSSDPDSTEPTETTPTATPASDPSATATPEWVSDPCGSPPKSTDCQSHRRREHRTVSSTT